MFAGLQLLSTFPPMWESETDNDGFFCKIRIRKLHALPVETPPPLSLSLPEDCEPILFLRICSDCWALMAVNTPPVIQPGGVCKTLLSLFVVLLFLK